MAEVIRVLRTIAIIDAVSVAVFAAIGWLFGMTPTQTLGATVIGTCSIALVLGWRAIVNAPPSRQRRDEWQHLGCDPVAPRLPVTRAVGEIIAPAQRQIEAPKREIQWHSGD